MSIMKADILYKSIKRSVETEKAYKRLESDIYTFLVANNATKFHVKGAIESLYPGVRVESVRVVLRKGKVKRTRRGFSKQADKKFAFVKLSGELENIVNMQVAEQKIDGDKK